MKCLLICLLLTPVGLNAARAADFDYCSEGENRTTVLIDRTTAYDAADSKVIVEGLERIFAQLAPGSLLTIHTIVDASANSETVFEGCRPGCKEGGILDWVKSACSAIRARKDDPAYLAGAVKALRPMLNGTEEYPRSDILRTIREVSKPRRGRPVYEFIIFSDLLKNSDLIPYQRDGYFEEIERVVGRIIALGLYADLTGAGVTVFGFGRSHNNNVFGDSTSGRAGLPPELEKTVTDFWRAYFKQSGAETVTIRRQYSE